MLSDVLFVLATLMWCQKLELHTLHLYAWAVAATFVGKFLLTKGGWI